MALFKILRGHRSDLDAVPKVDGHAYFCTDDGSFWVDHQEENEVVRTQINRLNWEQDIDDALTIEYNEIAFDTGELVIEISTTNSILGHAILGQLVLA